MPINNSTIAKTIELYVYFSGNSDMILSIIRIRIDIATPTLNT